MKRVFLLLLLAALPASSQIPFRSPRATFLTPTGQPLSGGCIFTYLGGTTTAQATYTDYTLGTPNSNPVILDSTGSAQMWLGVNAYKFVAYSAGGSNCSSGTLQWTVDQVPGNSFLNGTIAGATITNPAISGGTATDQTMTSEVMTGSSINSTTIGQTAPAAGAFTSLGASSQIVPFSVSPAFNASSYGVFVIQLSANVTSSTLTGGQIGQQITIEVCQNGTGGFTFAWPSNLLNPPTTISSGANTCTFDLAFYDQTVSMWQTVATFAVSTPPVLAHAIVFADLSNTVYGASATVNLFNSPVAGTIPIGGAGTYNGVTATSKCTLTTAATASTTFMLKDGSTAIGTVAFAAAGTVGVINISAAYSVASGDVISITAPASADATAAGLNCSIVFGY
jgi:hypothetical protein